MTLTYVMLIDPVLAVVPALYGLSFAAAVRDHMRRVGPALAEQRAQYGRLAAVTEEVITGIVVLRAGEIIEKGSHERLQAGGHY